MVNQWTAEELELLKQKYPCTSNKELVFMFPRHTFKSIVDKAMRVGLKKTAAHRSSIRPWNTGLTKAKEPRLGGWPKGYTHSEEAKKRIAETSRARWADPEYRERLRKSHMGPQTRHKEGVKAVIETLEMQGFRCVSLINKPRPDAIAIKNGMIFAVEYETGVKPADFDKYVTREHNYDDVIWIIGDVESWRISNV